MFCEVRWNSYATFCIGFGDRGGGDGGEEGDYKVKAYILTENDMELLKTTMESWEHWAREKYPEAKISNLPEGEILGHIRYHLWGWIMKVKGPE
jgi:hypothetical protein